MPTDIQRIIENLFSERNITKYALHFYDLSCHGLSEMIKLLLISSSEDKLKLLKNH